ncbi:uncharacterized protein LOC125228305 [Leguminivora glycinivorella]|uniref:uncharacterized protein LOC125228305 n=1 Tax=Leguminivora glycinivorella TaxID=1035111 RepID=UPI00200E4985|nr:uncharacterized protein LOC125228305 [Leguminivora glycinivorella]
MVNGRGNLLFLATILLWLAPGQGMPELPNRRSSEVSSDECESSKLWAEMDRDTLLCASNDVTYLNLCEFQKALDKDPTLKLIENGPCFCDPEESHEWNPVCASNGQSYANNCELSKARRLELLFIRHLGLCNAMLKRNTITYRELQKVKLWSSFMPHDLYVSLSNRDLAEAPPNKRAESKKLHTKHERLAFGPGQRKPKTKNKKKPKYVNRL